MRHNLEGVIGELTSLPGCSQVVVSHGVYLPEEERGKGKGTAANRTRQKLAFFDLGYDLMLCTVDASNEAQRKTLTKTGWWVLTDFPSRRTGHTVELWACKAEAWYNMNT